MILIILFVIYVEDNKRVELILDKCIDGDTAWFILDNERVKIRFLGIDTPESTNMIEEYGRDASDYTCSILKSANDIYLEYDMNSDKEDKYGRVLGWVFVDNNNFSELLLSEGYASVDYIYGDYLYIDDLCSAQEKAYYNKLGIWSIYDDTKYNKNYCMNKK